MEKATDWLRLWRELVQVTAEQKKTSANGRITPTASRRWATLDSTIDFISSRLNQVPNATLLDIGAGNGRLTVALSKQVRHVTAIDSSQAMVQTLQENLLAAQITNIEPVQGTWPDLPIGEHDFSLCSHAMYGSADFYTFIQQMMGVTRHTCFLLMRAPVLHGIMADAAMHIWGHPYDSPNFQVAYNAMLQMGIFPNVLIADAGLWDPWVSSSLEEALAEIKGRFGVGPNIRYDDFLTRLLQQRLIHVNGQYLWPRSVRSALIYWEINP